MLRICSSSRGVDLAICTALFLAAASAQMPTVFRAEFTGEDEYLFSLMSIEWIRLALGYDEAFQRIAAFYYPPLQSLLPAPLMWFFGPSEWVMRLPGALFAAAAVPLLYAWVRNAGESRATAAVAGLMMGLMGVLANHAYALTCGLFIFGATLSASGLARFIEAESTRIADRGWLRACGGWFFAATALPDAYFYLPVLGLAYLRKRRFVFTPAALAGIALVIAWTAAYAVWWIYLPSVRIGSIAGGEHKIKTLFSALGTIRLGELVRSFASGSSWIAVALAPLLMPLGWRRAGKGLRWAGAYFGVPLALWTFVFDYSNVRSGHMLLAFPFYAALWAIGAGDAARRASAHGAVARAVVAGLFTAALVSGLWQSFALHMTDRVPESRLGPTWWVLKGFYPEGRRLVVHGQHAAAVWILRRAPPDQLVAANLGGSFGEYYTWRRIADARLLAACARDPARARAERVRYYAHSLRAPLPHTLTEADISDLPISAEVRHRGETVMRIYDLWREPRELAILDADAGRRRMTEIRRDHWRGFKRALREGRKA